MYILYNKEFNSLLQNFPIIIASITKGSFFEALVKQNDKMNRNLICTKKLSIPDMIPFSQDFLHWVTKNKKPAASNKKI